MWHCTVCVAFTLLNTVVLLVTDFLSLTYGYHTPGMVLNTLLACVLPF